MDSSQELKIFKNSKRAILLCSLFVLSTILIEIIQSVSCGLGVFPSYFYYHLGYVCFFALIGYILPKNWLRITLFSILLAILGVIAIANPTLIDALGTIFKIEMLGSVSEAKGAFSWNLIPIAPTVCVLLVFALFAVGTVFVCRIKSTQETSTIKKVRNLIFIITTTFCVLATTVLYAFTYAHKPTSGKDLTTNLTKSHYAFTTSLNNLQRYGTFHYYFMQLLGISQDRVGTEAEAEEYLSNTPQTKYDSILHGVCQGDNVIIILAESFEWYAINENFTPVLYALANGYNFDAFKASKNTDDFFYDFTPRGDGTYSLSRNQTSYNLANENQYGLSLVNYHSKAKTDYSEDSILLGNYPYNTYWGSNVAKYKDVDYSFALPNQLKQMGYSTNYLHSFVQSFYSRKTQKPKFGFETLTFVDTMENDAIKNYMSTNDAQFLQLPVLDSAFIQLNSSKVIPTTSNKQLSFFASVSTHGSLAYTQERRNMIAPNIEILNKYDWIKSGKSQLDEYVENYLASAMELEYSVASMIYELVQTNQLDNTLLVFFSDHQMYYEDLDVAYKNLYYSDAYYEKYGKPFYWAEKNGLVDSNGKMIGSYHSNSSMRYNVPAFLYSTKIDDQITQNHLISKFTQAYDVSVTVRALLGVDYNQSYYMGYPIINNVDGQDKSSEVIISDVEGILNKDYFCFALDDILYTTIECGESSLSQFKQKATTFMEKWINITMLYEYDKF